MDTVEVLVMAAPFDDSELARIARSNSLQDYMSIPWNDDFRMFNSLVLIFSFNLTLFESVKE